MNWYAVLPILVFGGPAAGFLWELAVGLFCRTRRYLLWVPVLAGALGLVLCAASPVHTLPFSFLLLCWGCMAAGSCLDGACPICSAAGRTAFSGMLSVPSPSAPARRWPSASAC